MKLYKRIIFVSLSLFMLSGCGSGDLSSKTTAATKTEKQDSKAENANDNTNREDKFAVDVETPTETTTEETAEQKAKAIVSEMSLEEKAGQVFMIAPECIDPDGGDTTMYSTKIGNNIKKYHLGGIILFAKNILTPSQTTDMIKAFQNSAETPLFMAVDEEGGRVARLGKNPAMQTTQIEEMSKVGASGDLNRAYEIGQILAKDVSKYGFNLDFAPDADVLIDPNNTEIGTRSFGSDPNMVGQMVQQVVKGLEEGNVSATLKHFPGHGGSEQNSHEGLSLSNRTLEQMESAEFVPFKMGIEGGVDCVMVAHMSLPNIIGDNTPATLSKIIVNDILKNEMGFKGIVVSDAMAMGAITTMYTSADSTVKALNAGIDMVLMPENLDQSYNAVITAVKNGQLSEERLDDAVTRIMTVKLQREVIQ